MRIGYLHVGPPQHGVCRYGRLLAAEAKRHSELTVIEAEVTLTADYKRNRELLVNVAKQLTAAEVIHIQYSKNSNKSLWGEGWAQLRHLWYFTRYCKSLIVVTLHDIYNLPPSHKTVLQRVYKKLQPATLPVKEQAIAATANQPPAPQRLSLTSKTKQLIKFMYSPDAMALRWLLSQVKLIFVCSEEEAQRLSIFVNNRKTIVVPHFVELRSTNISATAARTALKLNKGKTVTLLGFIHQRKGHRLLIEAMPKLPPDVQVIFAGKPSPGHEEFVQELIALADLKGVGDRLQVTGYLSEAELDLYLAATDLAVCPFQFFSASGSLSTWISVARPILIYDLPQIIEYDRLEPAAIHTFYPYTPTALAQAICRLLPTCRKGEDTAVARLRNRLSLPVTLDTHLNHYRYAAKSPNSEINVLKS